MGPMTSSSPDSPAPRARRTYDSTRRREMAGETRQRIVQAGSELLHASPVRDWGTLTIRSVAERAGVHERTVYRHFVNERGLRDAVMAQLEAESGIVLEGMQLQDVGKVARRIIEQVASFPLEPRPELDPTLTEANQRQHAALLDAVEAGAPSWSLDERRMAAAILDVLWSVAAFERLVRDWQLEPDRAAQAIDWVIAMVEGAVRQGRSPTR
jgi:AcrR family transcriptional regulator